MKKKLFFVSLAVALVTAGATVGIMFALGVVDVGGDGEDKGYGKEVRYESLIGELASILDLEEEQVESAIKKAAAQRRTEALQGKLDSMVEKGTLSREQADAYLDWYKDKPDVPFLDTEIRRLKGREYAKPDGFALKRGPKSFMFEFRRGKSPERPLLEGIPPFFGIDPEGPSFRYGPNIFTIPFGRGQFREGPSTDGPPPFFGIEPDGPSFWFRQDGEFLPPAEVICEYMGDAFGEWWVEICDDDYYEYYEYGDDDWDDDRDGNGDDNDDRDYN